jgi:hypothetical protein
VPDYPYAYGVNPVHPIGPRGARLRFFRRRAGEEEQTAPASPAGVDEMARWRELLSGSVAELNASLERSGAPFRCALEEDDTGLSLRVFHLAEDGSAPPLDPLAEEVEEHLDPADLPRWLERLRSRLGIVVDERA